MRLQKLPTSLCLAFVFAVTGCSDDATSTLDVGAGDVLTVDKAAGDVGPAVHDGGPPDGPQQDDAIALDLQPASDAAHASDTGDDGTTPDATGDTFSLDSSVDMPFAEMTADTTVDAGSPDATVDSASPDIMVDTRSPDATVDTRSPDATVDTRSPDATVDTLSPDATVDTRSPDATVDTRSPDATVDTLSPDTTLDTLSPDTTLDTTADAAPSADGNVDATVDTAPAPSWLDDTTRDFPQLISALGLFPDPANRSVVHPRLRYYEPRYPLWTDDADKTRWFYLPSATTIDNTTRAWVFPDGTVFFKHFEYPGQAVETRVMRKRGGSWDFVTYQWNATNDEASLTKGNNVSVVIIGRPDLNYVIPREGSCKDCHEDNAKQIDSNEVKVPVIGFDELRLNHTRAGQSTTQIAAFAAEGLFSTTLPSTLAAISGTATEVAAKGWIHGNCAHCHNSGFKYDARHQFLEATTINVPQNGAYVVPGDAATSGLYQAAFNWANNGQWPDMAPIGMSIHDPQGEVAVRTWINSLP